MKILHVINNLTEIGGAEKMLANLVNASQNDEIMIISLLDYDQELVERIFNDKNLTIKAIKLNKTTLLANIFELKKTINAFNPDIIQTWMYASNVIVSLVNLIFFQKWSIFWGIHHSLAKLSAEKKSTLKMISLSKLLSKQPKAIIYCSEECLTQHNNFGFHPVNGFVILNGHPMQEVNHYKLHDSFCIGMAGRFHKVKDWQNGIEAVYLFAKQFPEQKIKLIAVGQDIVDSNEELMEYAKNLLELPNVVIELKGVCKNMHEFYKQIDLFVLSSISEGLPNVLCESISYGIPCIGTDVGGVKSIIDGIYNVVPASNTPALSNAIKEFFAEDSNKKLDISNQAFQRAKKLFDINSSYQKYNQVWQEKK